MALTDKDIKDILEKQSEQIESLTGMVKSFYCENFVLRKTLIAFIRESPFYGASALDTENGIDLFSRLMHSMSKHPFKEEIEKALGLFITELEEYKTLDDIMKDLES